MPDTSTKVIVNCDICGDPMKYTEGVDDKRTDLGVYACFPCKHMIWESELYRYAEHVTIKHKEADSGN